MVELILEIYEQISDDPSILDINENEIEDLFDYYIYTKKDVLEAFRLASNFYIKREEVLNIRYLTSDEIKVFTPTAYGFIMSLQMAGIIGVKFVDMLLTRAVIIQNLPFTQEDVSSLVEYSLLNPNPVESILSFELLFYTPPDEDEIN